LLGTVRASNAIFVFSRAGDVRKKHGTHSGEIARVLAYYFGIARPDVVTGGLLIGSPARRRSQAAQSFRFFAQIKVVPHD
jgi:hypothetical protein